MHPQPPPPSLETLQRDGVIEVPRIDRVDRHHAMLAAIPAALAIGRCHLRAKPPGLGLHLAGESRRQFVLADDRLDIDTRRAWAADHLEQPSLRRVVARRPLGNLNHHTVTALGLRLARLAKLGQVNVVRNPRVGRHDVPKLPRLLQRADHLRPGALKHLDHLAAWPRRWTLAPAAGGRWGRLHQYQHAVVVHRRAGCVGGNVDGRLRRIGRHDPAAATAVHEDAPGDQVLVGRQREPLIRQAHHTARPHEAAQFAPHLPGLRLAKPQFFGDVVRPGRDVLFARQQTQQSILKIHQVVPRLSGCPTSGVPPAISLPPARLYRGAIAPTTQTFHNPPKNHSKQLNPEKP